MTVETITRHICDRCELTAAVNPHWWGELKVKDGSGTDFEYDLCTKCMGKLATFLTVTEDQ